MAEFYSNDELLAMTGSKLLKPTAAGTEGQVISTEGGTNLRPVWKDFGQVIYGTTQAKINGGLYYWYMTGATANPHSEFLEFQNSGIYLGENKVQMYIGTKRVVQVFSQTASVYKLNTKTYIYNEGTVPGSGIGWTANGKTRPNYTNFGHAGIDSTNKRMWIQIDCKPSDFTHNAHVITTSAVTVPQNAKYMYVRCCVHEKATAPITMTFGLLGPNAPTSYSADGGQLQDVEVTAKTQITYKMLINDDLKGRSNLYAVVNGKRQANKYNEYLYIYGIWFE